MTKLAHVKPPSQLQELEARILRTTIQRDQALAEIANTGLFTAAGFGSYYEYAKERWDLGHDAAKKALDAAAAVEDLRTRVGLQQQQLGSSRKALLVHRLLGDIAAPRGELRKAAEDYVKKPVRELEAELRGQAAKAGTRRERRQATGTMLKRLRVQFDEGIVKVLDAPGLDDEERAELLQARAYVDDVLTKIHHRVLMDERPVGLLDADRTPMRRAALDAFVREGTEGMTPEEVREATQRHLDGEGAPGHGDG